MTIDIVIPTSENVTRKHFSLYYTLRSILNQSKQPVNIFVVENFSFEETRQIIDKEFGKLVEVLDGTKMQNNISFARNQGADAGNSEIIIFMDDDVVIGKPIFFQKISDQMKSLDFYCGALRYWTKPDWHTYLDRKFPVAHVRHILRHKSYLPKSIERLSGNPNYHELSFIGHFGAIKRSVFNEVKGFDQNYKSWSYQDTDLMMRMCKKDYVYDLMYCEDIFVYHLAHGADKALFIEQNKKLFEEKQLLMGAKFNLNHFFGIFDDDSYSVLSQ